MAKDGHRLPPRERVLQNTRRLLTFGAATGGAVIASCGYVVVDPAPRPAMCSQESNLLNITAFQGSTGRVAVVIPPVQGFLVKETISDPSGISGGTFFIKGPDASGNTELIFTPNAGATELVFGVTVNCTGRDQKTADLRITVHLGEQPDAGSTDGGSTDGGDAGPDGTAKQLEVTVQTL